MTVRSPDVRFRGQSGHPVKLAERVQMALNGGQAADSAIIHDGPI